VEFASVVDAVRCAVEVQQAMPERNTGAAADNRIELRIGINLGDVIVEGDDLYGDGVNIAARIEALADPGGVFVSNTVHDHVRDRLPFVFEDLGEQQVKNIARAVRIYRVCDGRAAKSPAAPALPLPDKPSIAVLPFLNMSGDPEQEYFADGIAEDVIALLSKSRGLFVIARNSSFTYKGRAVDVKQVGRELGVRYVLEGSVRRAGNRVRVTGQLIEAAAGGHLWAERYDRDLTDIFAVQDEITASVSAAILPSVERSERERAARKPPSSLDGWESYHRGMWHLAKVEAAENVLAQEFFQRALTLDPGFAAAQAAMALSILTDGAFFYPEDKRQDFVPRGAQHARRSIALDPTEAVGHSALAIALTMSGRHDEASREGDLAVSLDPNSAWAFGFQGAARSYGGRPHEAINSFKTAMRLSPFDPITPIWQHFLARAYYWMGEYQEALVVARQVCQFYPDLRSAYRTLLASLGQTGQAEEASRVMAEAVHRFGNEMRLLLHSKMPEVRPEDHEHLIKGYRKAGVIEG
jgi:adenylate cyclase